MEDINKIILPDLSKKPDAKKTAKKTAAKRVKEDKETLPRVNRKLNCRFCDEERILNPDQYQKLFDIHGSEEEIQKEFECKPCYMEMKINPFLFWTKYGDQLQTLCKNLKTAFDVYRSSARGVAEARALQTMCGTFLKEAKISDTGYEFIISEHLPTGLKIKNFPFVGDISLFVYENRKSRIRIS